MHMCFAIGALIGPFLVRPFMLPYQKELELSNHSKSLRLFGPEDVRVFWAFMIVGICSIIVGFWFLVFYINDICQSKREKGNCVSESIESPPYKSSQLNKAIIIIIAGTIAHVGFSTGGMICKTYSKVKLN